MSHTITCVLTRTWPRWLERTAANERGVPGQAIRDQLEKARASAGRQRVPPARRKRSRTEGPLGAERASRARERDRRHRLSRGLRQSQRSGDHDWAVERRGEGRPIRCCTCEPVLAEAGVPSPERVASILAMTRRGADRPGRSIASIIFRTLRSSRRTVLRSPSRPRGPLPDPHERAVPEAQRRHRGSRRLSRSIAGTSARRFP